MTAATSERSWLSRDDVELLEPAPPAPPVPPAQPTGREPREREIPPSVGFAWVVDGLRPYFGIASVVAGVISILLGWYGVSGEVVVAKQVPYLASGGLLGVCFFILGGRLLLIEDLRRDSGRLDHVEVLVEELHAVLLEQRRQLSAFGLDRTQGIPVVRGNGSHALAAGTVTDVATATGADTAALRVVPGGATYHRDGCAMLTGKRVSTVKPATAIKRSLSACPLCGPADVSA